MKFDTTTSIHKRVWICIFPFRIHSAKNLGMYLRSNLVVVHSFLAVVKHISSKPKIRNTSFRASSLTRLFATPLTSQSLALPFAISPFSTVANINNIMPSPPYHYLSVDAPVLDCSSLASDINVNDEKRNAAYDTSRKLNVQLIRARTDMELPSVPLEDTAEALAIIEKSLLQAIQNSTTESTTASSMADRSPREANLSMRVEEYVRLAAFYHFLTTGTLMPPSRCASYATDEEYLAGACMGLCQELARYAIGRATTRDLSSVKVTRDLVQEILDYLLKFDFRNGPLRRKFDGTKYVLKTLETLLYELAVTGAKDNEAEEPDPKRMKVDQEENNEPAEGSISHLLDELEEIRKRMVHRDDLREQLIKKCRDGQKAAKQAIYALHRGDPKRSLQLLKQCEECITKDLLPIVKEEPGLRSGAFSNCLEEYAEATISRVAIGK